MNLAPDTFYDIEGPIALPGWPYEYVWLALGLIVLAVVSYFLFKRKKAKAISFSISPYEEALKSLSQIDPNTEDSIFALQLSTIVRFFLEKSTQQSISYKTTEEFLNSSHLLSNLGQNTISELVLFFKNCDLIKFAKQPCLEKERQVLLSEAQKIIKAIHEHTYLS